MKHFYIITSPAPQENCIVYDGERLPLTRKNLDRVITEIKMQPGCHKIKLPDNIEELLIK